MIVLKGRSDLWQSHLNSWSSYDSVIHLSFKDLLRNKPRELEGEDNDSTLSRLLEFVDKVDTLLLVTSTGTSNQLAELLQAVESSLTKDCSLTVSGFAVSGATLERLTTRFECLTLSYCRLGKGWWKGSINRGCDTLTLEACTGASPLAIGAGQGAWPCLHTLSISITEAPRFGAKRDRPIENREQLEEFASWAAVVFWSDKLQSGEFTGLSSVDFLCNLPNLRSMKALWLGLAVSPKVLAWTCSNRSLTHLTLSWEAPTDFEWSSLGDLKGLKLLALDATPLADRDLAEISTACSPTRVAAYYTKLTAASWPVILGWKSLRSFWGSEELRRGEVPELPEATNLKEFVAVNARTDWFRQLLSRYPGIKVIGV